MWSKEDDTGVAAAGAIDAQRSDCGLQLPRARCAFSLRGDKVFVIHRCCFSRGKYHSVEASRRRSSNVIALEDFAVHDSRRLLWASRVMSSGRGGRVRRLQLWRHNRYGVAGTVLSGTMGRAAL